MRGKSYLLILSMLLLILVLTLLIVRSIGLEGEAKHIDLRWIYTAGRCWLEGLSPYNQHHFYQMWASIFETTMEGRPYVYPPTSAIIAMPLALFSWSTAKVLFDWGSILMLMTSLFFIGSLIRLYTAYGWDSPRLWVALSAASSVAMLSAAIFTGQTPIIALTGCLGALYFTYTQRTHVAALCMVLALIKPQLVLIPLILVLFERPKAFVWGSVYTAVCLLVVYGLSKESHWLENFFNSLTLNAALPENQFANLTLAYRVADSLSIPLGRFEITAIGVIGMVVMRIQVHQESSQALMLIGLAFILTALFAPLHNYDLSILSVPVAFAMTLHWQWIVAFLPGIILSARPASLVVLLPHFMRAAPDLLTIYLGSLWLLICTLLYLEENKQPHIK